MGVVAVTEAIQKFSEKIFFKPCRVLAVKRNEDGWLAEIEIIMEDERMRRYARSPIIGLWRIHLDKRYNVMSFEKIASREATALDYAPE